jgi:DNA-binding transcriptional regulator YiaG
MVNPGVPMSALMHEVCEAQSLPPPVVRKAIREGAGVAQERFAGALGVHRVTLARWESRTGQEPRGERRAKYARALRELQELTTS